MAIRNKYSLIKYYYTQMFKMTMLDGASFYTPLFFEFPDDPNTYKDQKYNVMIGDSLKLSILSDSTDVKTY